MPISLPGCLVSPSPISTTPYPPPATEMDQLHISPAAMLEDEINWLDNFEPSWTAELETSAADNTLLAGHLRLIKTLLSLCGTEKEQLGQRRPQLPVSLCGARACVLRGLK